MMVLFSFRVACFMFFLVYVLGFDVQVCSALVLRIFLELFVSYTTGNAGS